MISVKIAGFFNEIKNSSKYTVIYGAGHDGRLLADVALHFGCHIACFADKGTYLYGLSYKGIKIVSIYEALLNAEVIIISIAIKAVEEEIVSVIDDYYLNTTKPKVIKKCDIPFETIDCLKLFAENRIYTYSDFIKNLNMCNASTGDNSIKKSHIHEGNLARQRVSNERKELIEIGRRHWKGTNVLIILPVDNLGGGMKVVINEAQKMVEMGVNVSIYNLESNRTGFEQYNWASDLVAIYGEKISDFIDVAYNFDVICSTFYASVKHCINLSKKTKIAYYVQDFEPYFFDYNSYNYLEALHSYTIVGNNILVTKTKWNYNMVKENTGAECVIIGPSVDIDEYRPQQKVYKSNKIVICAMIRPESPRRSPYLTLDVLEQVSEIYGDKIEIFVFGSDPSQRLFDYTFWNLFSPKTKIKNLGILSREDVATVLSSSDIFVDLSEYQAMGLTAMEAMLSGCATIVPKNGGCTDFAKNEKNALVINTNCRQLCVEAICRLVDDRKTRDLLSKNAIIDICKFYPEKAAFNFLDAIFPAT